MRCVDTEHLLSPMREERGVRSARERHDDMAKVTKDRVEPLELGPEYGIGLRGQVLHPPTATPLDSQQGFPTTYAEILAENAAH